MQGSARLFLSLASVAFLILKVKFVTGDIRERFPLNIN